MRLPRICLDEHIHPRVADAFRPEFRTVEIAQTNRFRGRDESDFISELYRENAIFVTSDRLYVEEAVEAHVRHAGIIFVPKQLMLDEKVFFAALVGGYIRGACSHGSRIPLRGCVLYPGMDGLHSVVSAKDTLEVSWRRLFG